MPSAGISCAVSSFSSKSGSPIFQRPLGNSRGGGSSLGIAFQLAALAHASSRAFSWSLSRRALTISVCSRLAKRRRHPLLPHDLGERFGVVPRVLEAEQRKRGGSLRPVALLAMFGQDRRDVLAVGHFLRHGGRQSRQRVELDQAAVDRRLATRTSRPASTSSIASLRSSRVAASRVPLSRN